MTDEQFKQFAEEAFKGYQFTRNAIMELIEEIERLRAENADMRKQLEKHENEIASVDSMWAE